MNSGDEVITRSLEQLRILLCELPSLVAGYLIDHLLLHLPSLGALVLHYQTLNDHDRPEDHTSKNSVLECYSGPRSEG